MWKNWNVQPDFKTSEALLIFRNLQVFFKSSSQPLSACTIQKFHSSKSAHNTISEHNITSSLCKNALQNSQQREAKLLMHSGMSALEREAESSARIFRLPPPCVQPFAYNRSTHIKKAGALMKSHLICTCNWRRETRQSATHLHFLHHALKGEVDSNLNTLKSRTLKRNHHCYFCRRRYYLKSAFSCFFQKKNSASI